MRDGVVVAAVEQERLNRIKHTNKSPTDAIRACLSLGGIAVRDLDAVAYYSTETFADRVLDKLHLRSLSARELLTGRSMVQRMVRDATGDEIHPSRVRFVSHHWAHGVSAFYQSGYSDALVLLDGQGEGVSGMIFTGRGGRLERGAVASPRQHSLGLLYREVIRFHGYDMFDEYKVMGMAPTASPGGPLSPPSRTACTSCCRTAHIGCSSIACRPVCLRHAAAEGRSIHAGAPRSGGVVAGGGRESSAVISCGTSRQSPGTGRCAWRAGSRTTVR